MKRSAIFQLFLLAALELLHLCPSVAALNLISLLGGVVFLLGCLIFHSGNEDLLKQYRLKTNSELNSELQISTIRHLKQSLILKALADQQQNHEQQVEREKSALTKSLKEHQPPPQRKSRL